jgi:hypothetical protein
MAAPYGTMLDFGGTVAANRIGWDAGVREIDMHPLLIYLSPTATVTFNLLAEVDFSSATPEWMQRTLAAIDVNNAVTEAADYTYVDQNVPARVQQVVRHMRKTAQVGGRAMHDKVFSAVADLKRDQIETRMLELARDINYALINSTLALSDEATASRFRGILSSLSGASNTAVCAPSIFTETSIKDQLLMGVYNDGWTPDVIVMPPRIHSRFDTAILGSNTTRYVDATAKAIANHINIFDTPFGRVQTVMERGDYLTDDDATAASHVGTLFALQRNMWQIGYFRRTWMEEPPRDGDRWRGVIQVEWGLKDLAGTAGFSLTAVGTS